jgi:hypothetical protein
VRFQSSADHPKSSSTDEIKALQDRCGIAREHGSVAASPFSCFAILIPVRAPRPLRSQDREP